MNCFDSRINERRSARLKAYDYSSIGAYFVTICTQNRDCLFGTITVGAGPRACPLNELSDSGKILAEVWHQIPEHYPGICVDQFVVMPNHIHGIVLIQEVDKISGQPGGQTRGFAPTGSNLSFPEIVKRFKSMTTNLYSEGVLKLGWPSFKGKLWQRNYYEHVIRNEDELNEIREYIITNPLKWTLDRENPEYIIS